MTEWIIFGWAFLAQLIVCCGLFVIAEVMS
jgi:hypothetical protein